MNKNRNLNIRCTEEQANKIKELAKNEGLTVSDYILSKLLNLKLVREDIIKECPLTIKDKKGKVRTYNRKYVSSKRVLKPISEVVA